jgi:hypothetical protein
LFVGPIVHAQRTKTQSCQRSRQAESERAAAGTCPYPAATCHSAPRQRKRHLYVINFGALCRLGRSAFAVDLSRPLNGLYFSTSFKRSSAS